MINHARIRIGIAGLGLLLLSSVFTALSASNSVPVSHAGQIGPTPITANDLKPPECNALNLTAIFTCPAAGGNCDGTDASELILGSPNGDTIKAGKGDDCILGGGGDDDLRGDQNTDVCIGGPGADTFHPSCETEIQ
jgi:hypothetical protein